MTIPSIAHTAVLAVNIQRPIDHAYFLRWLDDQIIAHPNMYAEHDGGDNVALNYGLDYGFDDPDVDAPARVSFSIGSEKLSVISNLAASGVMYGSSWGRQYRRTTEVSVYNRVVQHACPTQAVFNALVSNNSRVVLDSFVWPIGSTPAPTALNRNGYNSLSATGTTGRQALYDMLYWDFADGESKLIRPYHQKAPVSFNVRSDVWPIIPTVPT
jgi:hypothetical protein